MTIYHLYRVIKMPHEFDYMLSVFLMRALLVFDGYVLLEIEPRALPRQANALLLLSYIPG